MYDHQFLVYKIEKKLKLKVEVQYKRSSSHISWRSAGYVASVSNLPLMVQTQAHFNPAAPGSRSQMFKSVSLSWLQAFKYLNGYFVLRPPTTLELWAYIEEYEKT